MPAALLLTVKTSDPIFFLPPRGHRARQLALILLALGPLAIAFLSLALGQDANWDLRNYHWYNAYAFINGRYGFDLLPSQTPWFYNPTIDVPFYLLATHTPAIVAGFLLSMVQGLNFILLFMLAYASLIIPNPRQKVFICAALSSLGMLGGGGIALIGTTFYDNVTSLGMFLSALLVIRFMDRMFTSTWTQSFLLALLCGLPSGLMMGLKLPSVIFCVGLCFALLFISSPLGRRVWISFAFGCGVLIGIAITLGHWAWFLQHNFGSPLFPYFNQIFRSPLAPLTSARDTEYITHSLPDFLFFPFIFAAHPLRVGEIPWRDLRLPILYALLPLTVLLRLFFGHARTSPQQIAVSPIARYLLWVAVLSYLAWVVMFCIYRYAVPLEMLAPLLIVFAVGYLPLKVQTKSLIAGFILIIIAVTVQPGNWYRRKEWSEHYIEMTRPELGPADNTMLLMAGYEPYSHLATLFPPEMPIVRVQSNFAQPDQAKGINAVIHARISNHIDHGGRFLLLIPPWQEEVAEEALNAYGLTMNPSNRHQTCQILIDRLYDDKDMALCNVQQLSQPLLE